MNCTGPASRVEMGGAVTAGWVRQPATVEQARRDLDELGPDALLVAGGTSMLAFSSREWSRRPAYVVSLRAIGGDYRAIVEADGGLRVGAGVSLARLAGDRGMVPGERALVPGERALVPALMREAASTVAFSHIRRLATLGGNLVNGRFISQLLPVLAVLRARLVLRTRTGAQVHGLDATGRREPPSFANDPRSVIAAVEIPTAPHGARHAWVASARDRARIFAAAVRDQGGDIRLSSLGPGGLWAWHSPAGSTFSSGDARQLADAWWRDMSPEGSGGAAGDQLRQRALLRKVLLRLSDDGEKVTR